MIEFVARNQVRWLSLAAALALSAVIVWMLTDPQFTIRNARTAVVGAGIGSIPVDRGQVEELFKLPQNLFLVSGAATAEQLQQRPAIAWAQVRPQVDGTVALAVQPARAVANWSTGEGLFLLNPEGTALAAGFDPGLGLVFSSPGTAAGDGIDPAALETGRRLQQTLPGLGFQLAYLQHLPATGMIARTASGALIYLGPPEAIDAKLAALAVVVGHARTNNLRLLHVDLRPIDRPSYKAVPDDFNPREGIG